MDLAADDAPSYTLIRDLPESDRPRERLRDAGSAALSNPELLAILLRVGSSKESALSQAQRILAQFGGIAGLHRAAFAELCGVDGLGPAKVAQIKAALELGVRAAQLGPDERAVMRNPEDIANLMLAEMSLLEQEHVRVVSLDSRGRIIDVAHVYQGSVHAAHVRIGELLSNALRVKATAVVMLHNHPSGDPMPSAADIKMTQQMCEASKLMDVEFYDHLVIGGGRYVSMRATGLGFPRA